MDLIIALGLLKYENWMQSSVWKFSEVQKCGNQA